MTQAYITLEEHRAERNALEVICLADVAPEPIDWLWPNFLAVGKVSILAGEGGKGKSTLLCDLAARTTTGTAWPDDAPASAPGTVIILTSEDDVEDTLTPRLMAAGADRSRVLNVRSAFRRGSRHTFSLQEDLAALESEIGRHRDVRLVIFDPLASYLGKGVDSYSNADVRRVLEPLGDLAVRTRTAVVCNNHFSKGGSSANNRMIGSVGFVNYARAGFIVTPDADDPGRLLFMPSKMNIAPIRYGLAYRIESAMVENDILTSRIVWQGKVDITADEALAAHEQVREGRGSKADAMDFLRDALAFGARPASDIKREAADAGLSPKSLRNAREALGIKPVKQGMEGGWAWELPKVPDGSEGAFP
jgi:putative DNA primase/helicase